MNNNSQLRRLVGAAALGFGLTAGAVAQAGSTEGDVQELVRQVRRNMVEVEKEIDRAQAETSKQAGEQTAEDIQKIIDSMKSKGQQAASDIDEVIKKLPP
jgi:molecular chaperone GrpE (heat shock protein)